MHASSAGSQAQTVEVKGSPGEGVIGFVDHRSEIGLPLFE